MNILDLNGVAMKRIELRLNETIYLENVGLESSINAIGAIFMRWMVSIWTREICYSFSILLSLKRGKESKQ
jgi:hypothetical protein